ncbi:MAG: MBL fold metallo-hydrolase [Polyangiales bacterium]
MGAAVEKTLHELGNGIFAYTQLPGSWGWSNSGLITDGGQSLLVDTLFDERITAEMLATMRRATPAAEQIEVVVNTHGNGDHCYGNSLVADAEIIGTVGCIEDLREAPASRNRLLMRAAKAVRMLGPGARVLGRALQSIGIDKLAVLAEAGELALPLFGDFDFSCDTVLPNRTFQGDLELRVGDKTVVLIELGPAHTRGDAVVWVPDDKILFTGDILFKDAHPIIWEGPVSNWITGLYRLLEMDVETLVPGHGPLADQSGLREMLHYLEVLSGEARKRYDAGMPVEEAVIDIQLSEFDRWLDSERVYVNVDTLYRDFSGDTSSRDVLALFAGMSRTRKRLRARA